jgi:hypothetical protein
MKDRILQILACAAAVAFAVFFCYALILETQAGELEITQHLYDQAILEIEEGNKDLGCRILQDALKSSEGIIDDFETYNQIWAIGNKLCNWVENPSTVRTSN